MIDKEIHIVGPRRLQNELLLYFLEQETGARCHTEAALGNISPVPEKDTAPQRQILLDCLAKDMEHVLAELQSDAMEALSRDLTVLFNITPDLGIEEKAVALGVRGFFYEHIPLNLFLKGVNAIFAGELWLSREIMSRVILDKQATPSLRKSSMLTLREAEILALVAVGSTNEEIADKLSISTHTVKTHIYNIFKKINVPNRFQAALWAAENL